jgi:diguanylate cyclase (GGDEF)-like protein/PAS domain S-box-containing protein
VSYSGSARESGLTGLLLDLSSDWYWEQDAELRFTRVEARDAEERALAETIIGKLRWETGVEVEGGWDAHRALLETRAPFRDVLMWRRFPDGRRRYMSVSGEPMYDEAGQFSGYRGIGRDITKQKRMQQLLKLQQAVIGCLAEASSMSEALSAALRVICEAEGWDCAEFWRYEASADGLRRYVHWSREDDVDARRFIEASRGLVVRPGGGLVGTVWQTGELMWLADAGEDPRGLRKALAERNGLRGSALLPVRYGGGIGGVLGFYCRRVRPTDKRLIQALNAIVTQIGQFLQRMQAEEAVRQSEARFRSLTDLSSDWYWEQDTEYRFTRLEGRQVAGGDKALRQRLIGTRRWDSDLDVEGGWDAHRALLDARKPFHNVGMRRVMSDGRLRYLSVSGEPVFDGEGTFIGYRGVGREVTAERRGEQLLQLEHKVARTLASAGNAAGAVAAVLRAVCEQEGWACGRAFRVDEASEALVFQQGWSIPDPAFERFIADSKSRTYKFGEGLAGRAWQTGQAVWTADVSLDSRVHPGTIGQAVQIGIRGVFAFPFVAENKIIGVLSFSSPRMREPDERLLEAARVIGSHLGQFIQRAQAEESLRESESRFRSLTQMSSDFFWESDQAYRLVQLVHGPNYPAAYMGRAVIGKALWEIPSQRPDEAGWAAHRSVVERRLAFRDFEFARAMPDGAVRHFSISGDPRFSADGEFVGYRGVGRDVTEIALARERIATLAYSDPLTGLANRTSLGPSLDQAVQRARRRRGKLAVVFVDLDGFKQINDVHGHDAGDALLVEVAVRLRAHLRSSDLVARLGGDEFLVVLEEVTELAPVEVVARKLLGEMARPYDVGGPEARVTASIGISVYPDDASDTVALMKHADTAMYAAKQAGKDTFRFYSAGPAANEPAAGSKSDAA